MLEGMRVGRLINYGLPAFGAAKGFPGLLIQIGCYMGHHGEIDTGHSIDTEIKIMKTPDKKLLSLSWIPYVFILFEMLYMATPFAVFFYGVYKPPLELLASGRYTAWLVQSVLPHFTQSSSIIINALLTLSVPFMLMGLIVFIIGFIQIYWAKLTKKGAVTGGAYRFIRHPQYTAWTLFGFGMSIFWSRLIVWLMFITMTFIYYFLAKAEERECFEKYPETYKPYYEKTGMFFPKSGLSFGMPQFLPKEGLKRIAAIICVYLIVCSAVMFAGINLRRHTINSFSSTSGNDFFSLSLTDMPKDEIEHVTALVLGNHEIQTAINGRNKNIDKLLIYIIPEEWSISELGVENRALNPMANVRTHGNPEEQNPHIKKVLISEPDMYIAIKDSRRILEYSIRQKPIVLAQVDLEKHEIVKILKENIKNKYGGIPVPLF
jgi:protein-S-isoprenylcysteine O-methyltransferase Ste14